MQDLITEIWESIRRNKLRTSLTGFSVSWGIFMIIVLLGAGNGLMNSFNQDSEGFSTNTMEIYPSVTSQPYKGYKTGRYMTLNEQDMNLLARQFPDIIDQVTTSVSRSGFTLSYKKKYLNNMSLNGTFPGQVNMDHIDILAGRFINNLDIAQKRKVVVITHMLAKNLLEGGTNYQAVIGKKVKVIVHAEYGLGSGVGYMQVAVIAVFGCMTYAYYGEYQIANLYLLAYYGLIICTAFK